MIATSQLASDHQGQGPKRGPRAHNGRAAFRLFHPPNVFPHLGDPRTIPQPLLVASPASTNPTVQAEATPQPAVRERARHTASYAMQYAMQYAAGRHLPRQQSALLPWRIA
jgi:hypothetical protein